VPVSAENNEFKKADTIKSGKENTCRVSGWSEYYYKISVPSGGVFAKIKVYHFETKC
jgi:hypothetical protein